MNFFSQAVPMDIDVNVPMHAVPMHAVPMQIVPMQIVPMHSVPMQIVPMHSVPMQIVPMHSVPKHVTFVSNYAVSNYAKPTQVVHYVYSDSMIIDEHPNKVILR